MWSSAGLFIGGAMFGATFGIAFLLLVQVMRDVDGLTDAPDAEALEEARLAGYDEGLEAGRQLERTAQTAKRSAAGRKAAETRKAKEAGNG